MTSKIKLGYELDTSEQVDIPLFHTVITGITRHGKSETMNAIAERANNEGYTILAFDVKNPRDYAEIGTDIPIYLEEHTDPTTLKGLLENQSGMGLNFQFSELIKMYEPGDTYHDMLERMDAAMDEDVHPVEEDKLRVLVHLLTNLTEELDRVTISDSLELKRGEINVMDLHEVDDSIQQLAIAGSVQQILDEHQDTIILLDEAHNFIPQRKKPPARDPLVKAIREGAANNNWLWISDQTITGVDKDPLKQVGVWVLGKQREKNEAGRVLDQIPGSTSYSSDDVMTLEKGHFIVALDDAQPLVYVQPSWLDDPTAESIASQDQDLSNVKFPTSVPDGETMDQELQEKDQVIQEKEDRIRELESTVEQLQNEKQSLEDKIDSLFDEDNEEAVPAGPGLGEDQVRGLIEEYIEDVNLPERISVLAEESRLVVYRETEPIEAKATEDDPLGLVAYMYATGELPVNKGLFSGDYESLLEERGYNVTLKRTGILDEFCKLGLMEKAANNRYSFVMQPDEAIEKGLIRVNEVEA